MKFEAEKRMKRGEDFQKIFGDRCSARDDVLLVFVGLNDLPHARLGLSVSRKVGNAVVRNRWKRRIREAFRLQQPSLPAGLDLVVIPTGPVDVPFDRLCRSLLDLVHRARRKIGQPKPPPGPRRPKTKPTKPAPPDRKGV